MAYSGDTYCYGYYEHNQGCSAGQYAPYDWRIAQNKGQDKSGEGVCIDIYVGYNPSEHSAYNCKHKYEYAFEEPYSYGWAAHVWNWGSNKNEIWGWCYCEE